LRGEYRADKFQNAWKHYCFSRNITVSVPWYTEQLVTVLTYKQTIFKARVSMFSVFSSTSE